MQERLPVFSEGKASPPAPAHPRRTWPTLAARRRLPVRSSTSTSRGKCVTRTEAHAPRFLGPAGVPPRTIRGWATDSFGVWGGGVSASGHRNPRASANTKISAAACPPRSTVFPNGRGVYQDPPKPFLEFRCRTVRCSRGTPRAFSTHALQEDFGGA